MPYLSICGCGPTAATLHYQDNDKTLIDGQTMLTDQGHSFHHYCSDITISFPTNGRFTEKQAAIYNVVLNTSRAVFQKLQPGADWVELHLLAERTTLEGLVKLGLITGDIDEMMEKRIGFLFQPHGGTYSPAATGEATMPPPVIGCPTHHLILSCVLIG